MRRGRVEKSAAPCHHFTPRGNFFLPAQRSNGNVGRLLLWKPQSSNIDVSVFPFLPSNPSACLDRIHGPVLLATVGRSCSGSLTLMSPRRPAVAPSSAPHPIPLPLGPRHEQRPRCLSYFRSAAALLPSPSGPPLVSYAAAARLRPLRFSYPILRGPSSKWPRPAALDPAFTSAPSTSGSSVPSASSRPLCPFSARSKPLAPLAPGERSPLDWILFASPCSTPPTHLSASVTQHRMTAPNW